MEMVMKKKHASSLEELIDGVELAGVATYLGEAENASVNFFV